MVDFIVLHEKEGGKAIGQSIDNKVMHRVALCFNGREIAVGTVESWEEAIAWCQNEWDRRKKNLLVGEAQRFGWISSEMRYWL